MNDLKLSEDQSVLRAANQQYSSHCKSKGNPPAQVANVVPGSLVYIKGDGDKTKARERFMVVEIKGNSCTLQKLYKSQIRSKPYHLKLTEIYPVIDELPHFDTIVPRDSDSDDDDDVRSGPLPGAVAAAVDHLESLPDTSTENVDRDASTENVDTTMPVFDAGHSDTVSPDSHVNYVDPPAEDLDATLAYDNADALEESVSPTSDPMPTPVPSRTSVRRKAKPIWTKDYDMSTKKR